ncbi:MAG: CHAT domain-containing protein, partial [Pseudanabaena sp. LacPavin_0818_WC45_MAG_42_6]|nr:CHAT domain-containing protein [Pseudanabaena sp. LacPavin_0818_WC45_MAG_42_6]
PIQLPFRFCFSSQFSRVFWFLSHTCPLVQTKAVSDGGTQKLMDAFYASLKKGVSPTESLRLAQISLIRGGEPFDHPYFWSAFFLIGNGL